MFETTNQMMYGKVGKNRLKAHRYDVTFTQAIAKHGKVSLLTLCLHNS